MLDNYSPHRSKHQTANAHLTHLQFSVTDTEIKKTNGSQTRDATAPRPAASSMAHADNEGCITFSERPTLSFSVRPLSPGSVVIRPDPCSSPPVQQTSSSPPKNRDDSYPTWIGRTDNHAGIGRSSESRPGHPLRVVVPLEANGGGHSPHGIPEHAPRPAERSPDALVLAVDGAPRLDPDAPAPALRDQLGREGAFESYDSEASAGGVGSRLSPKDAENPPHPNLHRFELARSALLGRFFPSSSGGRRRSSFHAHRSTIDVNRARGLSFARGRKTIQCCGACSDTPLERAARELLARVFGICEYDLKSGRPGSSVIYPHSPFASGSLSPPLPHSRPSILLSLLSFLRPPCPTSIPPSSPPLADLRRRLTHCSALCETAQWCPRSKLSRKH